MTPKQFIKEIAELAQGKYHTCQWARTVHRGEIVEIEMSAYISGYGWTPDLPTAQRVVDCMKLRIATEDRARL